MRKKIFKILRGYWRNLRKPKYFAFSLIELLVVIGIIGILSAIVVTAVNPRRQFDNANDSRRLSDTKAINDALVQYQIEMGGNVENLNISTCPTYSNIGVNGIDLNVFLVPTYISSIPIDPDSGCSADDTCYDVCVTSDIRFSVIAPNSSGSEVQESTPSTIPAPTPTSSGHVPPPANPFI